MSIDAALFDRFAPTIRSLTDQELNDGGAGLNEKMRLAAHGDLEVCYVPFEHINPKAKVVLVGITPGRTQMVNALREARHQLNGGADAVTALIAAKRTGAFSGSMRPNLVALLDCVGLNRWLGLKSCDELFGPASDLLQSTSALQNAVFVKGENYNGTPNMTRHTFLQEQLARYFGSSARTLDGAIFVPLGDKVAEALHFLAGRGMVARERILDGLPRPSGANAERIAYFVGRKSRAALSPKTNADKLDSARDRMIQRIAALNTC